MRVDDAASNVSLALVPGLHHPARLQEGAGGARGDQVHREPGHRGGAGVHVQGDGGRGLHSSTFQLNLGRFGHTSPCPPV
jgi:hypothetical protein